MKSKESVTSNLSTLTPAILGTYEGECADATITNKNGLDITREVWENVFASDDYRQAISLGWYIGFLGHPEDPNCMDFEHACIVMTEGRIDASGKVFGKFNLIDTPVGRIVKAFQDAGVVFGISVRGAGDVIDNSVDPETFIFRGFDLVTFPAFPESIPTFTAIAASSDVETQKRYKRVCAAVNENMGSINDVAALDIIQSQFAKQSKEYNAIEDKKRQLSEADDNANEDDVVTVEDMAIMSQRLDGVMELYLTASQNCTKLAKENEYLRRQQSATSVTAARKLQAVKRITRDQLMDMQHECDAVRGKNTVLASANRKLRTTLEEVSSQNLKYYQKISINANTIEDRERTISDLTKQLDETVVAVEAAERKASDLDAQLRRAQSSIKASEQLLAQYQRAYATLYANAIGADLGSVKITASTTLSDLQSAIRGASHGRALSRIAASTESTYEEVEIADDCSGSDLITI